MSLEDVKVGGVAIVCNYAGKPEAVCPRCQRYIGIVLKNRIARHTRWFAGRSFPCSGSGYAIDGFEAWEQSRQSAKQAAVEAAEAAERQREQEQEEKALRMRELTHALANNDDERITGFTHNGDVIMFRFFGANYKIREVAD